MNYREESFRKKFASAARHLHVSPDQLVSLKIRETVSSYQEYRELVRSLEHEAGVPCSEINGDLQGRGYLIGDAKTKLIVVEHETGLEILYVAGSIASLISLVPMVLQGWHALRGRFGGRHAMDFHDVEIRRIDQTGILREDHLQNRAIEPMFAMSAFSSALATSANLIENEMKHLTLQVQSLASRIDAVEKQLCPADRHAQQTVAKPTKNHASKRKVRSTGSKRSRTVA